MNHVVMTLVLDGEGESYSYDPGVGRAITT